MSHQAPKFFLAKQSLMLPLHRGRGMGLLTPSPFCVEVPELHLRPLCSPLGPSGNFKYAFPPPAWTSPPLPPQGTPIYTDDRVYADLSLLHSLCLVSAGCCSLWESLTAPT